MSIFKKLKVGDNEVIRFDISNNDKKFAKKLRKWKSQKLFKSQKSIKLGQKQSKCGNSPKNKTTEEFSFLILNIRAIFNCLWFAFNKTPIFWYFNLKYHI